MKLLKEHQYLLMQRESRVVVGKKAINLWLLVIVLTATFIAIAFSAGSMAYLNEKMNDPFTFWLNVNKYELPTSKNLSLVKDGLDKDALRTRYLFDDIQTEFSSSLDLFGPGEKFNLFRIQYYERMGSDLIKKVLDEDNVITADGKRLSISPDSINERSLGLIMTLDAVKKLGYNLNSIPAFVDCRVYLRGTDSLKIKTIGGYVKAPVPLLAVVRRLPLNKDILASKYLNLQYDDQSYPEPFNLNKERYVRKLYFFVPSEVSDFEQGALQCLPDSLHGPTAAVMATETSVQERLYSWQQGNIKTVYADETRGLPPIDAIKDIERKIMSKYESRGVKRVYNYDESSGSVDDRSDSDNGLSIHFNKLDSIRSFERYMKDVWNVQLEMSQVNSKDNFNAVSAMANVLTIALLLFSILSIIIFIVNMMQSYFQKVKRNLGTFKAFGISTSELTKVYVVIIVGIVVVALVVAMAIVWITEMILPLKEGEFKYIILWNSMTMWAVLIILISTICSVLIVMRRLLRQTPGDLIYDR